jgi:putative endonuclease
MTHYVYMIECINGHYYTGYTTDIKRRYSEHQAGSDKCKYTRAFPPKKLVATWEFKDKSEALRFEHQIKTLNKKEKTALISKQTEIT